MIEPSPIPPPPTASGEPATPPGVSAIPWVIVLLCFALGLALFIYMALIATQAGVAGA